MMYNFFIRLHSPEAAA